jgi:nucleotide-binding universal stress UspA family protein
MTMQHVLVATDLTDCSDMALERTLAICRDCNITLLHVLRAGLPNSLGVQLHTLIDGYLADHALYSAGSGSNTVQALVATGHPFTTIVSEAVSRRAQLIVMGEPALLRRAQLFVGTTAECVARLTDRPVLMVKRRGTGSYQRITVALDGSPAAVRALKTAIALSPNAEFGIIYAKPPVPIVPTATELGELDIHDRTRSEFESAFRSTQGTFGTNAPNVTIDIVETSAYVALRHASDATDLLVMGTHSKAPWLTGLEIGALAQRMLAEAPCDVLISPP